MSPEQHALLRVERSSVVAEARTWIGTPYHPQRGARVKGGGVDCLMVVVAVYEATGLWDKPFIPHYPPDWHFHRSEELYMKGLLVYCDEVPGPPVREPEPGDVMLWKFGRCFSHGAIVTQWPFAVHSYNRRGVTEEDVTINAQLTTIGENVSDRGKPRPVKFFRPKRWRI